MIKERYGDLILLAKDGEFDVIVHGCNCQCKMGAGIAKSIKYAFPEAYKADAKTKKGDPNKLGTCSHATVFVDFHELVIVNAYTQFNYWGAKPLVNYDAVKTSFQWVKKKLFGQRIGIPKIGAGLAGGDWNKIRAIIEEVMVGEDVTLVIYP